MSKRTDDAPTDNATGAERGDARATTDGATYVYPSTPLYPNDYRARIARRTAYELHEEQAARVYRRHRYVVDCECDCHAYDLTRNGIPVYIDSPDCQCYAGGERRDLRPFDR